MDEADSLTPEGDGMTNSNSKPVSDPERFDVFEGYGESSISPASPEAEGAVARQCVWCGAPVGTKDRGCPAPDGDGHLFSVVRRSVPSEEGNNGEKA